MRTDPGSSSLEVVTATTAADEKQTGAATRHKNQTAAPTQSATVGGRTCEHKVKRSTEYIVGSWRVEHSSGRRTREEEAIKTGTERTEKSKTDPD